MRAKRMTVFVGEREQRYREPPYQPIVRRLKAAGRAGRGGHSAVWGERHGSAVDEIVAHPALVVR